MAGVIKNDDPLIPKIWEMVAIAIKLSSDLNTSLSIIEIRDRVSEIIGKQIDKSTTIFVPFYTNFGKHKTIGKTYLSSCVQFSGLCSKR